MVIVLLQYVSLSKRFIPEVINYLIGVLFLAAYKVKGKGECLYTTEIISFLPVERKKQTSDDLEGGG